MAALHVKSVKNSFITAKFQIVLRRAQPSQKIQVHGAGPIKDFQLSDVPILVNRAVLMEPQETSNDGAILITKTNFFEGD